MIFFYRGRAKLTVFKGYFDDIYLCIEDFKIKKNPHSFSILIMDVSKKSNVWFFFLNFKYLKNMF